MIFDAPPPPVPAVVASPQLPKVCEDTRPDVHFGGPDLPDGALREELKARIEATPPGGEIDWATYYFRDRDLADSLIAAQRRGVRVRVVLEARPKQQSANRTVIAKLRAGLGDGLKLHGGGLSPFKLGKHLHLKVYAFSGPCPAVFVGSYNPAGDDPEDPRILATVGDQDRGHNLLVELKSPEVVEALRDHVNDLWAGKVSRRSVRQNQPITAGDTTIFLFPRIDPNVFEEAITDLGPGDRIIGAVSHMTPGTAAAGMEKAALRGADVQLMVNGSRSRVSKKAVKPLRRSGAEVERYFGEKGVPMHAKFVIVEQAGKKSAWFGSFNFNRGSQWMNQEVLIRSEDPTVVDALESRFGEISRQSARTQIAMRRRGDAR